MIVHIGFPKCASTTLQTAWAAAADVRFLGCDPRSAPESFYDPMLGSILERALRLGGDHAFETEAVHVRSALGRVEASSRHPVVVSNENLCHRLTPWDVPTDIKIRRMGSLVPPGATVVVAHRPARDFLEALHRQHLLLGSTATLDQFLADVGALGDLGPLDDIDLGRLQSRVAASFAEATVVFVDVSIEGAVDSLLARLGLTAIEIGRHNVGPKATDVPAIVDWNRGTPHRMGWLDWLEGHRVFASDELPDDERFRSSRRRHALLGAVADTPASLPSPAPVTWPSAVDRIQAANDEFLGGTGALVVTT